MQRPQLKVAQRREAVGGASEAKGVGYPWRRSHGRGSCRKERSPEAKVGIRAAAGGQPLQAKVAAGAIIKRERTQGGFALPELDLEPAFQLIKML